MSDEVKNTQQPTTSKDKKKKRKSTKVVEYAISSIIGLAALVMFILAAIAVRQGTASASSSYGIIRPKETQHYEEISSNTPSEIESTESENPVEQENPLAVRANEILDSMSLEEKVYQLFITSPDRLSGASGVSPAESVLLAQLDKYPVGGLLIPDATIFGNANQLTSIISVSQSQAKLGLFVGVSAEPGMDSGLSNIGVVNAYDFARIYGDMAAMDGIHDVGAEIGASLASAGFNLNFAPVADVLVEPNNSEIAARSFGSDPKLVADLVSEMMTGLQSSGTIACIKNFPGLACTVGDSRLNFVSSNRSKEELRQTDLVPFRQAIEQGADMIMISHLRLPMITGEEIPASLSPELNEQLLRQELGFRGVIVSDDLDKGSVYDRTLEENAVMAIQAGCDMLRMPYNLSAAADAILQAVENGELTEERINESVLRILNLKLKYGIIE